MDEVTKFTAHASHGRVEVLTRNGPVVVWQLPKSFQVIPEEEVRIRCDLDHGLRRRSENRFPLLFGADLLYFLNVSSGSGEHHLFNRLLTEVLSVNVAHELG